MRSFRQYTNGDTIVIHGSSFSLPGDIDFLQAAPEPGVPSTRSVRIFADVLTISGTVYNGGADVRITCRVLKLEQGSTIDTSAPEQTETSAAYGLPSAEANGQDGVEGLRGYDAGNVSILCGGVVGVGDFLSDSSATGAVTTRPDLVDGDLNTQVSVVVNTSDSESSSFSTCWLTIRAVGGTGGAAQDGQIGGDGVAGEQGEVDLEKTIEMHDTERSDSEDAKRDEEFRTLTQGETGTDGGNGGDGGVRGQGGDGGSVRFSAMHGTFSAGGMSTPEAEWAPALCTYACDVSGGPSGALGSAGQGGIGGLGGEAGNYSITVEYYTPKIKAKWDSHTYTHAGWEGDAGQDGDEGDTHESDPVGSDGSDPGNGAAFEEEELLVMLDVDHFLRLERVAAKAWLNGTNEGDELLKQVNFVKFFAAFLLEHTEDKDGTTAAQLAGLVVTSDISLERMQSGANYFGFMPGYTPRTTISTIMLRIDTLLPLAESTEDQLQTYDATVSTSDDIRGALDSANQLAAVDLSDQRSTLAELDETMASQLISINDQQREIARQWQGDDEAGIKGLVTIQAEFITALTSWEEPSTGPNWFKIGLLITGAVVSIAITVGTGGTAGVAVAGAALAAQASKTEEILEVLDTGISAAIDVSDELEQAESEEPSLSVLAVPITQDMDDSLIQKLNESIDEAAESTNGDIDEFADALKDAFKAWTDLCQARNASIQEYQETSEAQLQATAQVERLAAQLVRVNEAMAETVIDPNTPVLAEFMEACLDDQTYYLLREIFEEYAKLVGMTALSEDDAFAVSNYTTVADLAVMQAGYVLVYAEYQDGLVQVLTTFQTTLVLPEGAVQELATERKVELRFTSLPESLDMLEDIVVYTMALRVGQGAIKGSGYITAGVNCAVDSRAGLCCYNVSTNTDEYVATLVGEGNTGARLEGTDWEITLRYATNVTSIDFGKLQEADGGIQLIVTGIGSGPNVQANLKYAENLVIEEEAS